MMEKDAVFSICGQYRYRLSRIWDNKVLPVQVIGLNPSTANADRDDHTIRLLTKILTHFGYGGFVMTNLYGLITPHPSDLVSHPNPIGKNEQWLTETYAGCCGVIFAWGSFKGIEYRAKRTASLFPDGLCFGHNTNGSPRHPRSIGYIKDWKDVVSLNSFSKL